MLRLNGKQNIFVDSESLNESDLNYAEYFRPLTHKTKPKISVITPVLNGSKFIDCAIQSVIAQEYPNCEHIVVDGGSTDGTIDILKRYKHLKWISENDEGQSAAMNRGFSVAKGDIIVYLNADDYFLPLAFASVIPLFEIGAEFVVGKVKVVKENSSIWINNPRTTHIEILKHWEPDAFCVNSCGYFYLREVQESVGGFNKHNHLSMDLEFLMECSRRFVFTKIAAILGVFRNFEGTKTVDSAKTGSVWTKQSFGYVDRFLEAMHDEFKLEFNKARDEGYRVREDWRIAELKSVNSPAVQVSLS
jgi:glycosyltransferase involved in cell wall biosynthesis